MRQFSSYGPVNTKLHYYVPRKALIEGIITQLKGKSPEEGGITSPSGHPGKRARRGLCAKSICSLKRNPVLMW